MEDYATLDGQPGRTSMLEQLDVELWSPRRLENSIKESEISDRPRDPSESPPCCTRGMDLWSTCGTLV